MKTCECGCGGVITEGKNCYGAPKRFILGHNQKGKKPSAEFLQKAKSIAQNKKGKTLEEIFGKEKAFVLKQNLSKKRNIIPPNKLPREYRTCQCGCGETFECKVIAKKQYIHGHSNLGGIQAHNWRGGISFEDYGPEFNEKLKNQIRERDNYTCQECGYTQEQLSYKLPVHHIDYNKKNNHPENLISLCKSCHSQTGFNRDDWSRYFWGQKYCH